MADWVLVPKVATEGMEAARRQAANCLEEWPAMITASPAYEITEAEVEAGARALYELESGEKGAWELLIKGLDGYPRLEDRIVKPYRDKARAVLTQFVKGMEGE